MDNNIKNSIKQADIFANRVIVELSKTPPNWDQIYEYIEMIGSRMAEAVDIVYEKGNNDEMKKEYMSYIGQGHDRIKKRIVNKIKEVVKLYEN